MTNRQALPAIAIIALGLLVWSMWIATAEAGELGPKQAECRPLKHYKVPPHQIADPWKDDDQKLYDANLRFADLRGADLRGADLRFADLTNANLRGADLREACLYGANLHFTDLRGADLRGAHLRRKKIQGFD